MTTFLPLPHFPTSPLPLSNQQRPIATWISTTLEIEAVALRDLGFRDAENTEIFQVAKAQRAALLFFV